MIYTLCVAAGVLLAFLAARLLPPDAHVPARVASRVRLAAIIGAVAGAYLFEVPADLFGWAATDGLPAHAATGLLGGRTVLGGILGAWLAVEATKFALHYRGATGDAFALPLAIGLTMGRIGCTLTGCCPGVALPSGHPLSALSFVHHDPARFPATLAEAWFHSIAAVVLVVLTRLDWLRGRRFTGYMLLYGLFRFAIEEFRANPRILLGLTYYQWLSVGLITWSLSLLVVRNVRARRAPALLS